VGPAGREGEGRREVASFALSEKTTGAIGELARTCHTTVSTVLQGAFVQLLMAMTGQRDVAFGTTVSGRPAEVFGADSMVGLLINTVPVRASVTAETTTIDLLAQLQNAYSRTLDHQHLALNEIHRVTGQDHLFDTFFVYENYPIDAAELSGADGLAVTEFAHREYNHYPLAIQALPGNELGLRVEFDTEVFASADIDTLIGRFERLLVAMTSDPTRPLSSIDVLGIAEHGEGGVSARVHPCMVPLSAPIARVDGVFNAVVAEGDAVGRVMLEGRGAGGGPTASAVVADLIDIARGRHTPVWGAEQAALSHAPALPMQRHRGAYYLRLMVLDRPGVIADVTAVLRDAAISLESMLQRGRAPGEAVPVVLTTHECEEAAMQAAMSRLAALDCVLEKPALIRIEAL
jgi:hypothetical protein